jgi:hypothetical protein
VVVLKRESQTGERLSRGGGSNGLVGGEVVDPDHLVVEEPVPPCRCGTLVRRRRELVELCSRETPLGGDQLGGDTDLARRLGYANAFGDREGRYPHVELSEIDRPDIDLVLLPDEPYVFTESDGPEAFSKTPTRLVSGRLLTWYGPSLLEVTRPV